MSSIAIFRARRSRNKEVYEFMDNYPISYLLFTLIGIYFIYGAIKKPKFFMYDKSVSYFFELLGDRGATYFYLILGFISAAVGIVFAVSGM